MPNKKKSCKHASKHFGPEGYIQWHQWALNRYQRGWRQKKCKVCKLFVEWIKP